MTYKPIHLSFWLNICKESSECCDKKCRFLDIERSKCWLFERYLETKRTGKPYRCKLCISWEKKSTIEVIDNVILESDVNKTFGSGRCYDKIIESIKQNRGKKYENNS